MTGVEHVMRALEDWFDARYELRQSGAHEQPPSADSDVQKRARNKAARTRQHALRTLSLWKEMP